MTLSIYTSVTVHPTIATSQYHAGDVVGGLLTFDFGPQPSGGAILGNIYIVDDDNEKAAASLYLYTSAPTSIADHAAFSSGLAAIGDLTAQKYVKAIAAADYTSLGPGAYWSDTKINQVLAFDQYLYAYFVPSGTPTYTAATDLYFIVSVRSEG